MNPPIQWIPPPTPDPWAILDEARKDAAACHNELALAKYVWFHLNALGCRPGLYGVRLSYALSEWSNLAKTYPPALVKMQEVRDEAEKTVKAGGKVREAFHDYRSLNDVLDQAEKTMRLFVWLDANAPDQAKTVIDLARPALIRAKMFKLCGIYLNDDFAFKSRIMGFQQNMQMAEDPKFGQELRDFGEKHFSNETATLVALLAMNDRREEAETIVAEALQVLSNPAFKQLLEDASQGIVPVPWP